MTNRNQLGAFGYYMIGYFDVLGQSNKLLDLPTNPEPKDVVEHLRQTAAAVLKVRERFDGFLRWEVTFLVIPATRRAQNSSSTIPLPRLVRWGFSDSYTVAVPIMHGDDKRSAMVSGIYRTMMAACSMWMTTLSARASPTRWDRDWACCGYRTSGGASTRSVRASPRRSVSSRVKNRQVPAGNGRQGMHPISEDRRTRRAPVHGPRCSVQCEHREALSADATRGQREARDAGQSR